MKTPLDMREKPQLTWTVVHVLYTSFEARTKLLTTHGPPLVPSLESDGQWFFADIPIDTATGSCHGLEVAIRHRVGDEAVRNRFGTWLRDGLTSGLSSAASFAAASVVLQPGLFLDGFVPDKYPDALAVASGRAGAILRSVAKLGGIRASAVAVREELGAIYRAFLPDEDERAQALLFHAKWLESLSSPRPGKTPEARESRAEPRTDFRELELSALQPYDAVAEHLRAQLGGVTGGTHDRDWWNYSKLCTTLLARFGHIQVVRLWGPEYPEAFLREADILRGLASTGAVPP